MREFMTWLPRWFGAAKTAGAAGRDNTLVALRVVLAASVLVPALLFAVTAWLDRRETVRTAENTLRISAAMLEEHTAKIVEGQELIIARIDDRLRGLDWDAIATSADIHGFVQHLASQYEQIQTITLIDDKGRVRVTSRGPPLARPEDVSDRDYLIAARNGDAGTFIAHPYTDRLSGRVSFAISRPRLDRDGRFDGLIQIVLYPRYFSSFFASVASQPNDTVALLLEDGTYLVRYPAFQRSEQVAAVKAQLPAAAKAEGDAGPQLLRSSVDGLAREYTFLRVGALPLYVSFARTDRAILGGWYLDAMLYGAFGAAAAAALVLTSWTALRRARREQAAIATLEAEMHRRAAAETKLRRSEQRYRGYFEHLPECLFVVAVTAEGGFRFEAYNPASERVTGLSSAEVTGRLVDDVVAAETVGAIIENYRRCVELGQPIRYEETLTLAIGKRTFQTTLVPVTDETARIAWIMGSARDITEERKAQEQLRRAQRMEAIGKLTGGIAHDFNNLLTVVMGYLDVLAANLADERLRPALKAVQHAAERAASLTRHLLAFSRQQMLLPEVLQLKSRITSVLELLHGAMREDIRIEVDLQSDLGAIRVDPGEFELAILNIAVNARAAMPAGGVLRIEGRNVSFAYDQYNGTQMKGEFVALSLADTGVGMSPEVLEHAFEPFFTTRGVGAGSGLGLSQVYGFAKQSGGTFSLSSQPGKGTTVTLFLPRVEEMRALEQAPAPPADVPAVPSRNGPTVLIVEDDPGVTEFAKTVFLEAGFAVLAAGNAKQALAMLDAGAKVDLVLSDIVMPGGISGVDLARELRRRHPALPVLLTTGYSDEVVSASAAGFPVIPKPYRAQSLRSVIDRIYRTQTPASPPSHDGDAGRGNG